jgi:hypothetical protein
LNNPSAKSQSSSGSDYGGWDKSTSVSKAVGFNAANKRLPSDHSVKGAGKS